MNMKAYACTLLLSLPLLLCSCLKEEGVFKENGSQGIVELALSARNTSTPYATKSVMIEAEEAAVLPVTVNYTGVNGAPEDVQVTLAVYNAAIAALYPDSSVTALPDDLYELPAANVVAIPKGKKTATYAIKIKSNRFDLTKSYALGVKIAAASAGTISGNYSTGVYLLPVKSRWEGTYLVTYEWIQVGEFADLFSELTLTKTDVKLATVGPETLEAQGLGGMFGGYTRYTFYADGKVKVAASSGADLRVTVVSSQADTDDYTIFAVRYKIVLPAGDLELTETYRKIGD
ncbi:MAG: DUF1735 domain-containing protein [Prevotellaceae bacterium]|nr:DUF1735 domain-containing protein [Prevotellaceae bacterium]